MKMPSLQNGSAYQHMDVHGRARTAPRPVNLLHGDDFKCALLGSLGFSTQLIMRHTGLTPSQVGYRLRKGEIRRSDYRNGQSSVAENLLQRSRIIAVPALKQHLRNVITSKS
jgi:hypothetical protein